MVEPPKNHYLASARSDNTMKIPNQEHLIQLAKAIEYIYKDSKNYVLFIFGDKISKISTSSFQRFRII